LLTHFFLSIHSFAYKGCFNNTFTCLQLNKFWHLFQRESILNEVYRQWPFFRWHVKIKSKRFFLCSEFLAEKSTNSDGTLQARLYRNEFQKVYICAASGIVISRNIRIWWDNIVYCRLFEKLYTGGPRYSRGLRSKNYPWIPKPRIQVTREDLLVLKL